MRRIESLDSWFESYIACKSAHRSASEIERIFRKYILPGLGGRSVADIKRSDITRLIDSIAYGDDLPKPYMARAVASQFSAFYSWALQRSDALDNNPCKYAGKPARPASRERVLTGQEIGGLWNILEGEPWAWRAAVRLLMLTGQRRQEVVGASYGEFELTDRIWVLPGTRTKNKRVHLVPLSDVALATLQTVPHGTGTSLLFPSRSDIRKPMSGFSKAVARIRHRMMKEAQSSGDFTLHDIRRTVATGLQQMGTRLEVTESVLNHVSGSRGGIAGIYQRYEFVEEKRTALNAWAAKVTELAAESRSLPEARTQEHKSADQGAGDYRDCKAELVCAVGAVD